MPKALRRPQLRPQRRRGQGFIPPADGAAEAGHWGVLGMRQRAALVGGSLTIASAPGRGTEAAVTLPYPGVANRDPVCGMAGGPAQ